MARVRAPELTAGEWLNVAEPITLAGLRGRIVLLDFWTFCCINCIRVLDELRPVEQRFEREVVVVGVHSPKFPHEHDTDALQAALARHRVSHPVINDPELRLWRQYGIKGWPTVVVIDPEGYVIGGVSGEGNTEVLIDTIEKTIAAHEASGTLAPAAAPATLEAMHDGVLAFPGKVASDGDGRLAIADTGHGRVLVTDLTGRVEWQVDGLDQPQGVRFDADGSIVICDTGANRVVRARRGDDAVEELAAGLASPWDLVAMPGGGWLVAEAGRHRLWRIPPDGDPTVVAGTGREDLVDGPAAEGALAQPSGLARLPGGYAIADAEVSALRVLTDDGRLATAAGAGLFEWGDADGDRATARLQHPLGVAATDDGTMFVADTFNDRLRRWKHGTLTTLPVEHLAEPGGIDLLPDGRLVVADTNHHRVITVDIESGATASVPVDDTWIGVDLGPAIECARRAPITVEFHIDVRKADLDATDGYPVRVVVEADPPTLLGPGPRRWDLAAPAGHVDLVAGAAGTGTLMIDVVASVCVDGECRIERSRRRHPLTVKPPTRRARTATAPQGMALEAGDPEPGSPEPDGPGTSP